MTIFRTKKKSHPHVMALMACALLVGAASNAKADEAPKVAATNAEVGLQQQKGNTDLRLNFRERADNPYTGRDIIEVRGSLGITMPLNDKSANLTTGRLLLNAGGGELVPAGVDARFERNYNVITGGFAGLGKSDNGRFSGSTQLGIGGFRLKTGENGNKDSFIIKAGADLNYALTEVFQVGAELGLGLLVGEVGSGDQSKMTTGLHASADAYLRASINTNPTKIYGQINAGGDISSLQMTPETTGKSGAGHIGVSTGIAW